MSPQDASQALVWSKCLDDVLKDKESMKCSKALKRVARLVAEQDQRSKKVLHAEIESALKQCVPRL